jgi:hypothetical protein
MIASIDLDQLAEARAAAPGLLNLRRPKSSRHPQAAGDHERSDGLDRQIHAVALSELLGRQCRSKSAYVDHIPCRRQLRLSPFSAK